MNHIGPQLHDDRPRVVALGSGKGGTGKSTLCSDIARALTRYDFRVLCVDTAWSCPTLNIRLGCQEPTFEIDGDSQPGLGDPDSHIAEFIVPTAYPSVFLASIAAARRHPFTPPSIHPDEFIHQLHELDFDYVLLDLSDGIAGLDIGLFTLADIPVLVTTPEPATVRMTTQFLRAVLFRAIGYHPEASSLEAEILDVLYNQPLRLNAQQLRYDAPSANSRAIIDETMRSLETYMIVNQVREGAEHDLGFVLSHALHRELQLFPRVLSSLEYADRRWFYNRRTTGTGSSRNEEGLSNDIEMLARNIRDISLVDMRYPRPVPTSEDSHPALRMGLNPELSRNEVRQYCRRLWEGYRREKAISLVFSESNDRDNIADRLETLYRQVLTMPSESFSQEDVDQASKKFQQKSAPASKSESTDASSRRNRKTAPPTPVTSKSTDETDSTDESGQDSTDESSPADSNPGEQSSKSSRSDDGPADGERTDTSQSSPMKSPGKTLAELRGAESMSLQELSSRTHIGVKYLAAIEEIDLEVLPRRVYLRGYLREIARVFDVNPEQLLSDYFNYLESI